MRLLAECPLDTAAAHSHCLNASLFPRVGPGCLRCRLCSQRTQLTTELMMQGHDDIINSRR